MSFYSVLIKRLAQGAPVLLGLSILVFFISRVLPGDPVRLALGPTASEETVNQLRAEMGLNQPLYMQYVDWLFGIVRGDWGQSLRTGNNTFTDIVVRLPATLELVLVAILIAITLAIPLGVIAATNKDGWPDHFSRVVALLGVSMPRFWVAILFQVIFVGWLGLFPLTGRLSSGVEPPPAITHMYLIDSVIAGQWATFLDTLMHITLPAVALSLATLAQVMRLLRSDMIEEENKDYVTAVRGYGLPSGIIEYKYKLKNAFSSSLTLIGLAFGTLFGNAFLVELVFAWPGMAHYGVEAILYQDFNAIVGVTLVVGIIFVLVNIAVDLTYGYLDPRIRHRGE
ncbi:ABC transporter permease [Natrialba sp. INN-245]|uniref:ABC transporter permease n=1 Tax=Natrialba sp. INN-245 TaxID=2690967 RepID=UPI0013127097|nr:ABC transporter permease [Natrialba sp. INN-245]MWV39779.1 ABC transporter permease subunit [Natrialba sp. INN-245]